jgi:RNA methyltransferase, TrmH family
MPLAEKITSLQNTRVKDVVKLHRSRTRKERNLMVVEGAREILMAGASGLIIEYLMVCPAFFPEPAQPEVVKLLDAHRFFEVNTQIFSKMAYREQSDGLLAVMHASRKNLSDLKLAVNPLLLVLESVEKPGNLGAVLRTADAAAVDAVIICDPLTDIYNPNVIRSSIGCVFSKQIVACTSAEAFEWLQKNAIESVAASLSAEVPHYESDFRKSIAFIMGTEADGLSDFWLKHSNTRVKIPMMGKTDSLNVSVSAAILVYEALRQRSCS